MLHQGLFMSCLPSHRLFTSCLPSQLLQRLLTSCLLTISLLCQSLFWVMSAKPAHVMPATQETLYKMAASPESPDKMATMPETHHTCLWFTAHVHHGSTAQAHHCSTVLVLCHAMIQILFPYMGLALRPSPSSTSTPPPSWTFCVLFWLGCYVRASAAILRGFVSYLGFLIFYFYVLPCFMFLACVSWPSCDDVMCYSCLCVMLWLVALVMCLVSHWLFVSCDPYCLVFIALVLPLGVFDLKWQ